jgi:hypothetical protein
MILMFFLPKTPYFLYVKERYHEMMDVLAKMAKFNGIKEWRSKVSSLEKIESTTLIQNKPKEYFKQRI